MTFTALQRAERHAETNAVSHIASFGSADVYHCYVLSRFSLRWCYFFDRLYNVTFIIIRGLCDFSNDVKPCDNILEMCVKQLKAYNDLLTVRVLA